jgi:hypothetical protein
MKNANYVDYSLKDGEIDEFHLHELLDRLHTLQNMWENIIQNHPACGILIKDKAEAVQDAIGDLYQEIADVRFSEQCS